MKRIRWSGIGLGVLFSISIQANAANYDYPELMVVPRASERIFLEAKQEESTQWKSYLPIQVSALATSFAGLTTLSAPTSTGKGWVGVGVGVAWVALTAYLEFTQYPYRDAYYQLKAMPYQSPKEQLAKERLAEEEIQTIAAMGERLRWLSFITNGGAAIVMLTEGNGSPFQNFTVERGFQLAALALSVAPILYPFHSRSVAHDQEDYKKRIFGPIARTGAVVDLANRRIAPGVELIFQF